MVVMSCCSREAASGTLNLSDRDGDEDRSGRMDIAGTRRSGGELDGRPPDGSLMLGSLQQASVVRHDLMLWQVQVEL